MSDAGGRVSSPDSGRKMSISLTDPIGDRKVISDPESSDVEIPKDKDDLWILKRRLRSRRKRISNIKGLELDAKKIFMLRPEKFDIGGISTYGLVPEEVAKLFPELVVKDSYGNPSSIRFDLLTILTITQLDVIRGKLNTLILSYQNYKKETEKRLTELEEKTGRFMRETDSKIDVLIENIRKLSDLISKGLKLG